MILDTCTLVWLASGHPQLSATAADHIHRANTVFVSAISAFEIGLKAARGKLQLPSPAAEWYQQVLQEHELIEIPITGEIACTAANLPWHHRDPADRFIIATARVRQRPVLTPDPFFAQYDITVCW